MLAEEDIQFIRSHLSEWIATESLASPPVVYEIELRERMVRVEEALKNQGEELKAQRHIIEKILVQMDKRFEQSREETNKQFEQSREETNKRFEQTDKKIDLLREDSQRNFDKMEQQFGVFNQNLMDIQKEIRMQIIWSFGMLVSVGGLVVGILKVLN